jgi:cell division protein FtsL
LVRRRSKRGRLAVKKKRGIKLRLLACFLTLLFLSCLYIWQRVTVISISSRTKELKLEIKEKQRSCKYLQIELTQLASLVRMEKLSKQMGFIYPGPNQKGVLCESSDSTYLEPVRLAKNLWARLKTIQKGLLLIGDEAQAKENPSEP